MSSNTEKLALAFYTLVLENVIAIKIDYLNHVILGNKINILGESKVGPESVVQKKECIEISQEATQDRNKRVRGGKNQKRKRLKKDTGKTTKKKKKGK